jgi:hypothetical protein
MAHRRDHRRVCLSRRGGDSGHLRRPRLVLADAGSRCLILSRILRRLQDFERRLKDATSDRDHHVFALREYANFLDGVAHLHNAGRFGRGTAALCWDALCNSIAALEISEETTNVLEDSITRRETFEHLAAFRKKHKSKVEERKTIFRAVRRHDA